MEWVKRAREAAQRTVPEPQYAAAAAPVAPVELMTVRQAAAYAKVSEPTIYRWISKCGLMVLKSKGRVRIDKSALVQFLSNTPPM